MAKLRELAQGRGRYILQQIGFPSDFTQKKHTPCPFCGGKDRYRFTDYHKNGDWICSQCRPESGDWIDLALWHLGVDFKELCTIVEEILGVKTMSYQPNRLSEQAQEWLKNKQFLDEKSREFLKLTPDDPATKYLHKRGITNIPPTLRYLPAYYQDGSYHPCLIARIDNANGERVTYKAIHLTLDGDKASVGIVKKTLPTEREFTGASVKLYPLAETLAVCEGIETALAHHQDTGIATWALDNAGNMKAFEVPPTVKHLMIIADMDKSFTGQAAAYHLANRASLKIGKQGYALETVNVNLLFQFQADIEVFQDHGKSFDYLDKINQ